MSQPGQAGQPSQPGQSQEQVVASRFTATVTGEVQSVDQESGRLTLSTPDGQIVARFPPVALQNVKQGDQVTLAIGLMESNQPAASPGTAPSTSPGSSSTSPGGYSTPGSSSTGTR
jgi:hypothetical protein